MTTGRQRRRVKVGRRLGTAHEWEAVAGAAVNMARTWLATVAVCVDGSGRVVLVAGGEPGTHLREVGRVTATAGTRERLESGYRLRRDGWALYQAAVGQGRVFGLLPPVQRDGHIYSAEERAALEAWVMGEGDEPASTHSTAPAPATNSTPPQGVNSNLKRKETP